MRLAVFTNQFPGRVSTFFSRDMRALIEAGIKIDIFPVYPLDTDLWQYVPDILDESLISCDNVHHVNNVKGLQSLASWSMRKPGTLLQDTAMIGISASKYGLWPFLKSMYVLPKAWAWANKYANTYDHILAYWGNYTATYAYVSHRLISNKIPYSIFLHAGTDLYRDQVFLKQKMLYADNIITCSEFNEKYILDKYSDVIPNLSEKLIVYHHGLDFSEFKYRQEKRVKNRIIAVGRLEKKKGYDFLLRAVPELSRRGIDIEVQLVGDGSETVSLKALAEKLEITDRVIFTGLLKFNEVKELMSQATLLVHPSSALGDGVPNVIKEAMALGTPVVSTKIAGIPELIVDGKCGIIVTPGDLKELVDAIEKMVLDASMRSKFAKEARMRAEKKYDLWKNGKYLASAILAAKRAEISE